MYVTSFVPSRCYSSPRFRLRRAGHRRRPPRNRQRTQKPYEPQVGQAGKDVVWVPTPQALVDKMLDMAKVTPQDFVMDLGSGDGRTVITAAKRGARAMGIEYNPDMVELSKRNAAEGRRHRQGHIRQGRPLRDRLLEGDR